MVLAVIGVGSPRMIRSPCLSKNIAAPGRTDS
jgi:hypothetical protein